MSVDLMTAGAVGNSAVVFSARRVMMSGLKRRMTRWIGA
jgi:hypothetical protein